MGTGSSRVLTVVATLLLLSSVGAAVFAADAPSATSEPYTEFYVLGPNGDASNYPKNLTVGEQGRFVVGISNHEHRDVTYTLVLRLGDQLTQRRPVTVAQGETWEREIAVSPRVPGRARLRLLLYRGSDASLDATPYRRIGFWVNVSR